jgi:hypothetical protein
MATAATAHIPPSPILVTPDPRRRVTLPALPGLEPNQALEIVPEMDGSYRLVPVTVIPRNQLWAWGPEAMKKTAQGLQEHREGRSIPADAFLAGLEAKQGK